MLGSFLQPGCRNIRIEGQHYAALALGRIVKIYKKYLTQLAQQTADISLNPADWHELQQASPRELTFGAYANDPEDVAEACESLPENEVILSRAADLDCCRKMLKTGKEENEVCL